MKRPKLQEIVRERYRYDPESGQVRKNRTGRWVNPRKSLCIGDKRCPIEIGVWLYMTGDLLAEGEVIFKSGERWDLRATNLIRKRDGESLDGIL